MVLTLVTTGILVGSTAVSANAGIEDANLRALQAITDHQPGDATAVLDDLANVAVRASAENVIDATVAGTLIEVAADPASGVTIEAPDTGVGFSIGLPFAARAADARVIGNGIPAYDNRNGSATVPLVKDDGSVQITTVIHSEGSPTRFDYELDLPTGAIPTLLESGHVEIIGSDGAFIGGVSAPWAYDAQGVAVPTHYALEGSTLTQIVQHDARFAYPVVADPWAGQNLLAWAGVSYYSNYYAVDAKATTWGRTWNGLATHASHVSELKYKLGGNAWRVETNNGTIREQFLCHVAGNYFEQGIYNMESFRPATHWANQLNPWDQCNP